jgi:hypothetical protein
MDITPPAPAKRALAALDEAPADVTGPAKRVFLTIATFFPRLK